MSFLRYPRYRSTGLDWLSEVPADWGVAPFRRFAAFNPSKSEISHLAGDTPVSFLPMEAVGDDGTLDLGQTRAISEVSQGYTYIAEGDVSFAKITPCFENGKGAVARHLVNGIAFGTTELTVVRPNRSVLIDDFLHFLFSSREFRQLGEAHMYGAGGQKRVPDDFVREFQAPLPTIAEQSSIVAFLDGELAKIDALIAEQHRLIELLKEKRQAVISHAVTKGLNPEAPMKPSGVEWLGEIPAHWSTAVLSRISERVVVGIAEAATHAYVERGIPILRSTNIRAGKIIGEILSIAPSFAEARDSKRLDAGDLVTVRTGNAGVTSIVPQELDGCQCFTMLITTLSRGSTPEYYCAWMNSLPAQRFFSLEGWGTAQVNISVPILKSLPVPIPPIPEQIAITDFLTNALSSIDELFAGTERAVALLSERRTALISAAVTGKIDVRGYANTATDAA